MMPILTMNDNNINGSLCFSQRRSRRRTSSFSSQIPIRTVVKVKSTTALQQQQASSSEDQDDDNNNNKTQSSDPDKIQKQLNNAMMMNMGNTVDVDEGGGGRSDTSIFNDGSDNELNQEYSLYNPAPLFTGVVITALTFAITGYLFYVGITGDDFLIHPNSN